MKRVTVVADLAEEGWPSMDFTAEAIEASLQQYGRRQVEPVMCRPPMQRRFSTNGAGAGFTLDRFLNRFVDYPRLARRLLHADGLFHLADHSYSQLVHALPAGRTIVTCHDTDTFRCVSSPTSERRSRPFRMMTSRILSGLRKAARICADSTATREALVAEGLVPAEQIRVVPLPVHPDFTCEANAAADAEALRLLGPPGTIDLLNVGSTADRKRLDLVLEVFAELRRADPGLRLVRVGGAFTFEQRAHVARLNLEPSILVLPRVSRPVLAAVYRRAALVMLASEREGFGLPVVESLACGTPVAVSDLPVLREVGGDAASYGPVGDIEAWVRVIAELIAERSDRPGAWAIRCERGLARARTFSYARFARELMATYAEVWTD